jgi:hypothetical protein
VRAAEGSHDPLYDRRLAGPRPARNADHKRRHEEIVSASYSVRSATSGSIAAARRAGR